MNIKQNFIISVTFLFEIACIRSIVATHEDPLL